MHLYKTQIINKHKYLRIDLRILYRPKIYAFQFVLYPYDFLHNIIKKA